MYLKMRICNNLLRDECYVVIRGSGKFQMDKEVMSFEAGDFLFVPAGMEHRF